MKKCKFGLQKINYLGFIINDKGLEPGETKLNVIINFPIPRNNREIRRFIGLASYFRRFICNFAKVISPLTEVLKANHPLVWGERQEEAFRIVKQKMASKAVLALHTRKSKRTELHTDASAEGLSAMLFQEGEDGELHLVFAISRRTSDVERNYHSSKLEMLAVV